MFLLIYRAERQQRDSSLASLQLEVDSPEWKRTDSGLGVDLYNENESERQIPSEKENVNEGSAHLHCEVKDEEKEGGVGWVEEKEKLCISEAKENNAKGTAGSLAIPVTSLPLGFDDASLTLSAVFGMPNTQAQIARACLLVLVFSQSYKSLFDLSSFTFISSHGS